MPPAKASLKETMEDESEFFSTAFCCICLDAGDELISPCMCTGTQRFVHHSCLDHWRSVKVGTAFSQCTTCKVQFHLRPQYLEMKFRPRVTTDILLVYIAIQTAFVATGSVAYLLDKDGKLTNNFINDSVPILPKDPVPFYYCTGMVVFFALVGFRGFILHCSTYQSSVLAFLVVIIFVILGVVCSVFATIAVQKILQRHYPHRLLVKKELTKYVVEDLQGGYTPPKMDPESST